VASEDGPLLALEVGLVWVEFGVAPLEAWVEAGGSDGVPAGVPLTPGVAEAVLIVMATRGDG